jgi:2-aminoethylphosphonate-pyruvate transaminase
LAVDAALATFVRGRVLIVDNGLYCRRIRDTLTALGVGDLVHLNLGIGAAIDLDLVDKQARASHPEWIAIVHHETTTGLLNPCAGLAKIAKTVGARLFVDAVSSVAAHPLDGHGDVICFNSSKCLESLPGIAGVFWRNDLARHPVVPALDVGAYSEGMPSTPNVQAFIALDIALDLLAAENRVDRYRRLARHVWDIGSRHFEPLLEERDRSNVLTSFSLGGRGIEDLFRRAFANRMVIYPGQAHLHNQIFRVANMGAALDERAIEDLFAAIA